MHRNMARTLKNRASKKPYVSPSQLRLVNFETPFSEHLNPTNRAVYDPGDRNTIEGKIGLAKVRYGMDRIKARLKDTSESWVAMILVVMNLVRLAKEAPYFWLLSEMRRLENIFLNIIREIRYNRLSVILIPGSRLRLFQ